MLNKSNTHKFMLMAIHAAFLLAHVFLSFHLFNSQSDQLAIPLEGLKTIYKASGFDWTNEVTLVIGGSFICSIFLNLTRRIFESFIFGWPQFLQHSSESRKRAALLLLIYGGLTFFGVGALGSNADPPMDTFDLIYIFVATYFFGLIINIIDIFISSLIK